MKTNLKRSLRASVAGLLAVVMILSTMVTAAFAAGPANPYTGDPHHYAVTPSTKIGTLNENTSVTKFVGDDHIDDFLKDGGASSINDLVLFLAKYFAVPDLPNFMQGFQAGCSTFQVDNGKGGYYFGRNFDYSPCQMLISYNEPTNGYKNITTADLDLVTDSLGEFANYLPDYLIKAVALWTPLDGMNEKGLTMSINMISDDPIIDQDRGNTDQICVTAVRTILDKCATVDEALALLEKSDFHTWDGFMVHMAITDATGKHVVIEYIDNKISIVPSPINTNFYLTEGEKYGIGTAQSMIRYNTLTKTLAEKPVMTSNDVRDALASVAKGNFDDDIHTTEWSAVYDQQNLTATYYRQENYKVAYTFNLK